MRKYAIPCIISLLVAALCNIVDQIFIANADYLGSYDNAANTVVFPTISVFVYFHNNPVVILYLIPFSTAWTGSAFRSIETCPTALTLNLRN